ncbi:hypothetical protein ACIP01_22020 [Pseudomonas monteilii]|uniref:hypothetical protein n=1 Tax=Pseudomonas monteilii TaxID=76759 RepID=UPI00380EC7F4
MFTLKIPRLHLIQTKRPPRLMHRRLHEVYIKHLLWKQHNRLISPCSVNLLFGDLSPQMPLQCVHSQRRSRAEQVQSHIDPELMHETWHLAARHLLQDMHDFIHRQYLKHPCIDAEFHERRKTSLQLQELIREPFPEIANNETSDLYADLRAWIDQTRYFMKELVRLDKASERIMAHVLQEDLGL